MSNAMYTVATLLALVLLAVVITAVTELVLQYRRKGDIDLLYAIAALVVVAFVLGCVFFTLGLSALHGMGVLHG